MPPKKSTSRGSGKRKRYRVPAYLREAAIAAVMYSYWAQFRAEDYPANSLQMWKIALDEIKRKPPKLSPAITSEFNSVNELMLQAVEGRSSKKDLAHLERASHDLLDSCLFAESRKPLTPMQIMILDELDGKARTGEQLLVLTGSKETLYGKKAKGGLTELVQWRLVKNDRRIGYYRPDAPPPSMYE